MMAGRVNARLEAIVRLTILGPTGEPLEVDALIDSGFTGSLALSAEMIATLELKKRSASTATLADGTVRNFETYGAAVQWEGLWRTVVVSALGSETILGMVFLAGHRVGMDIEDGGAVEIQSLRP